jgi:hypothetical protein
MHRKHIMLDLAEPQKGMFENLRKSASEMLKVNFDTFAQVLKVHMNGYECILFGIVNMYIHIFIYYMHLSTLIYLCKC